MKLQNKIIWVTGASSGIGEALVKEAVSQGAKVILSARKKDKLESLASGLPADRVMVLPLDMEDTDSFPAALDSILNKWGRLDILVNNAGVSQRSLIAETKPQVVKKIINTNYIGPACLTGLVIPHMQKQKTGYCLFVSSVAGKFATPLRSSYSASKMGLQGYTDSLRAEVYNDNIKVSLVVPGFVRTGISLNALEGRGNSHDIMDPNQESGISPEEAAQVIIKGINKEKREIYCGLVAKTRFALFMARYFPGLLAVIMRNAKVT